MLGSAGAGFSGIKEATFAVQTKAGWQTGTTCVHAGCPPAATADPRLQEGIALGIMGVAVRFLPQLQARTCKVAVNWGSGSRAGVVGSGPGRAHSEGAFPRPLLSFRPIQAAGLAGQLQPAVATPAPPRPPPPPPRLRQSESSRDSGRGAPQAARRPEDDPAGTSPHPLPPPRHMAAQRGTQRVPPWRPGTRRRGRWVMKPARRITAEGGGEAGGGGSGASGSPVLLPEGGAAPPPALRAPRAAPTTAGPPSSSCPRPAPAPGDVSVHTYTHGGGRGSLRGAQLSPRFRAPLEEAGEGGGRAWGESSNKKREDGEIFMGFVGGGDCFIFLTISMRWLESPGNPERDGE